jgi:excisionase family DNA binding protein
METPKSVRNDWMSPRVAADYLGVAIGTLRNWTSARYVPHAKRGRVVRYHRVELDSWLAAGSCPGRTTLAEIPKRWKGV